MKSPHRPIEVTTHSEVVFPVSYHRLLKEAAKATVGLLPSKIWKEFGSLESPALSVTIVSRQTIAKLNLEHRNKNRPTDVLSFPSARTPGSGFIGDVLICWQVAKAQTQRFETTPRTEVQRLVVHGVLHLFGYDHELSPQDARRMFSLQNKVLRGLTTRESLR